MKIIYIYLIGYFVRDEIVNSKHLTWQLAYGDTAITQSQVFWLVVQRSFPWAMILPLYREVKNELTETLHVYQPNTIALDLCIHFYNNYNLSI